MAIGRENIKNGRSLVFEDSEFRNTLGKLSTDPAKKFNWDCSFNSHMDLFKTILN